MRSDLVYIHRDVGVNEITARRCDLQRCGHARDRKDLRGGLCRGFVGGRKYVLCCGAVQCGAVERKRQKIGFRQRGVLLRIGGPVVDGNVSAGLVDDEISRVIRMRDRRAFLCGGAVEDKRLTACYGCGRR